MISYWNNNYDIAVKRMSIARRWSCYWFFLLMLTALGSFLVFLNIRRETNPFNIFSSVSAAVLLIFNFTMFIKSVIGLNRAKKFLPVSDKNRRIYIVMLMVFFILLLVGIKSIMLAVDMTDETISIILTVYIFFTILVTNKVWEVFASYGYFNTHIPFLWGMSRLLLVFFMCAFWFITFPVFLWKERKKIFCKTKNIA